MLTLVALNHVSIIIWTLAFAMGALRRLHAFSCDWKPHKGTRLVVYRAEEVGHDHVRKKSGRVAPYITLYKNKLM